MKKKRAFPVFLRIGLALLPAAALAQAPPAPENPPATFRETVQVRVMDLDVSVTDSRGNPVPDLTQNDFRVTVDGKPVSIDYFTRVAEGTIHAPDLATASPDLVLAEYRKGADAYVPRQFLMYIDVGNLSPGSRKRGLEALRDLVTRLGPGDMGRVVLFDRRGKEQTEWTSSKETLFSALSKIESSGVGMSRLMNETQTLNQIDSMRSRSARESYARMYAEQVRVEVSNMLRDMSAELTTLTALPGKRAFLHVSGGFDMQPGSAMMQYAVGTFSLRSYDAGNMSREVQGLIQKANANQVTFYTVDARGLTAEGGTAGGDDPLLNRPGVAFFARTDSQAGLQDLATETGGLALLNSNALVRGLEKVYQDASTYYSVGVNLSNLPGAGFRNVRVTVARPGVTVRARRSFAARTPAERGGDVAQAALRSNIQYRGIPVTLSTAPPTKGKKYYALPIAVTVPASSLTFVANGDSRRAVADVYVGVMDDAGRMSDINREETSFTLPSDAPLNAPLRYTVNLEIRKGNARVVVNVRDRETGRMGTARADVHIE
ncbi:MAG: VWA domain-containing protein [Acidobacteriota bacterium]|nr:VWA domain-containing protein [Acidobacteriota bacterium]